MKTECPKCGSHGAWITRTEYDTVLRCLCGLYRVLSTTLKSIEIHNNDAGADVKLPKRGTFLWDTLIVVQIMEIATTREVTDRLVSMGRTFSTSDVSSYLTILRSKGLLYQTEVRRGVSGGSTWMITDAAGKLLGC